MFHDKKSEKEDEDEIFDEFENMKPLRKKKIPNPQEIKKQKI